LYSPIQIIHLCFFIPPSLLLLLLLLLLLGMQFSCMLVQWSAPFVWSPVCHYLCDYEAVTNNIIGAYIVHIIFNLTIIFYAISLFTHYAPGSWQIVSNSRQVSVILLSFLVNFTTICITDKLM
jgi:hypothetical protein